MHFQQRLILEEQELVTFLLPLTFHVHGKWRDQAKLWQIATHSSPLRPSEKEILGHHGDCWQGERSTIEVKSQTQNASSLTRNQHNKSDHGGLERLIWNGLPWHWSIGNLVKRRAIDCRRYEVHLLGQIWTVRICISLESTLLTKIITVKWPRNLSGLMF